MAYDDPEKKIYHLCIVNLVIGLVHRKVPFVAELGCSKNVKVFGGLSPCLLSIFLFIYL